MKILRKAKALPQNVLVIRGDNLGDFITSLPLAEVLKKNGVGSVHYTGKAAHQALTAGSPFIDSYLDAESPCHELREKIKLLGIDCVINASNISGSRNALKAAADVPIRIGSMNKLPYAWRYNYPVLQSRSKCLKSEAEYTLELLEALPLTKKMSPVPRVSFLEGELPAARAKLGAATNDERFAAGADYIVMHCGMRGSALNLPRSTYLDVLSGLLMFGVPVLLTGASKEEHEFNCKLIEESANLRKTPCYDVSGKFELRELAALLALAKVYFGPSTGPTHLAAAVGTPVVSAYPPLLSTSKQRWAPYGMAGHIFVPEVSCPVKRNCIGASCRHFFCMDKIEVNDILKKISSLYFKSQESGNL